MANFPHMLMIAISFESVLDCGVNVGQSLNEGPRNVIFEPFKIQLHAKINVHLQC